LQLEQSLATLAASANPTADFLFQQTSQWHKFGTRDSCEIGQTESALGERERLKSAYFVEQLVLCKLLGCGASSIAANVSPFGSGLNVDCLYFRRILRFSQ
jgi:hypothetical protein